MTGRTLRSCDIGKCNFFFPRRTHVLFSQNNIYFFHSFLLSSLSPLTVNFTRIIYIYIYIYRVILTLRMTFSVSCNRLSMHRHERSPFPENSERENEFHIRSWRTFRSSVFWTWKQERIFVDRRLFPFLFLFSWNSIRKSGNRIETKRLNNSLEKKVKDNSVRYSRSRITKSFYDSVYEGFTLKVATKYLEGIRNVKTVTSYRPSSIYGLSRDSIFSKSFVI